MTYDLAKQLKDAGFESENHIVTARDWDRQQDVPMISLPDPTLSELIEACGDDFLILVKGTVHAGFTAQGYVNGQLNDATGTTLWYGTPEEAVARLWLELNKEKR